MSAMRQYGHHMPATMTDASMPPQISSNSPRQESGTSRSSGGEASSPRIVCKRRDTTAMAIRISPRWRRGGKWSIGLQNKPGTGNMAGRREAGATLRELVHTNNAVLVSAIGALLDGAGIRHVVLDQNMS